MLWKRKTLMLTCRLDEEEWKEFRALVDAAAPYSNGYSAHVRKAIFEYMDRMKAAAAPPPPPPRPIPPERLERIKKHKQAAKKTTPAKKSSKSARNRK